jgi:hypothetical protein
LKAGRLSRRSEPLCQAIFLSCRVVVRKGRRLLAEDISEHRYVIQKINLGMPGTSVVG